MARTDFLTKQRKQITARLDELRPLYEEYLTLEKAHEALQDLGEPIRRAVRRGPGRPPGSRNRTTTRRKSGRKPGRPATRRVGSRSTAARSGAKRSAGGRGRSRSGSTRADQTLAAIKANPGSSIPELARRLKIRPNYLYRVTAQLQRERKIKRRGKEFHPA